ncbi:MAG: hypothetical protein KY397_06925 [Gemmatimonadetes bacterium]|nr:hypothetical protein [Gemmatimonadota bacterium]
MNGICIDHKEEPMTKTTRTVTGSVLALSALTIPASLPAQALDTGAIDAAVDQVIAANPDKVAEYKGGKAPLFGFFVGQVMKAMGGKANPKIVNERLRAKLD